MSEGLNHIVVIISFSAWLLHDRFSSTVIYLYPAIDMLHDRSAIRLCNGHSMRLILFPKSRSDAVVIRIRASTTTSSPASRSATTT